MSGGFSRVNFSVIPCLTRYPGEKIIFIDPVWYFFCKKYPKAFKGHKLAFLSSADICF